MVISLVFANLILKEENPFISASVIVNVADDWFPIELKLIDFVVEGIVVIEPSFKKVVAISGLLLDVKTSATFVGKFIFFSGTVPNILRFTSPTFAGFFEIKFFDAAAKSSGFVRLNFIPPAFVKAGDITNPSPSWGWPRTSIWYPLKLIKLP